LVSLAAKPPQVLQVLTATAAVPTAASSLLVV
jgi:hypothetical protein